MKNGIILFVAMVFGLLAPNVSRGELAFRVLVSFDGTNGGYPNSALIQANDRTFYGTTDLEGEKHYSGTVFKMNPNGKLNQLASFGGLVNGQYYSSSEVIMGTKSSLYGTIYYGPNFDGSIFTITSFGLFKNLHVFNGSDGALPDGLLLGTDGNFYATTTTGGTNLFGTVFKMTPNGKFITLYSFSGFDGEYRKSALVEGDDGDLYGTTMAGGTAIDTNYNPLQPSGAGTVFKMTRDGMLVWSVSFDGSNGYFPVGPLVKGVDGNFYGTTSGGGINWPDQTAGTIFKITPDGELASLYSFDWNYNQSESTDYKIINTDGALPDSLVQGDDGVLYGSTTSGGTNGDGTIFKITTDGSLTTLYTFGTMTDVFKDALDGADLKHLTVAKDGSLYGTAYYGGVGYGTIFHLFVNRPLISVSYPRPTTFVTTPAIVISGKTQGAVADVFYQNNGGDWTEASTTDNWTNWTANVALLKGNNVIRSFAVDTSGDASLTNTLKVIRKVPAVKK